MRIVYGLNTGDRLTVADTQMRRWSRELGTRVRKCTVIHEYPHFSWQTSAPTVSPLIKQVFTAKQFLFGKAGKKNEV